MIGVILRANTERSFNLPLHTKISIFGVPEAQVTSKGLQWELHDFAMNFFGKNSCFNRTIENDISLHVTQGTALVLIHQQQELTLGEITSIVTS